MKSTLQTSTKSRDCRVVRRSVALPSKLVDEVLACAPPEIGRNLNRLVALSLRDFVTRQKAMAFEAAMAVMAADPELRSASNQISDEFAPAEMDGIRS